jgi:hypothetical protein
VVSSDGRDGEISGEARMLAARAREHAARLPDAAAIAAMALTHGGQMSDAEVRELAATAITQAAQVSYLLGRLAGLTGSDDPAGGAGGQQGR